MCHFGDNINFKTESFLFEYYLLLFYKIYMYRSHKHLFIYLFNLCIPRSAHILYLVRVKSR